MPPRHKKKPKQSTGNAGESNLSSTASLSEIGKQSFRRRMHTAQQPEQAEPAQINTQEHHVIRDSEQQSVNQPEIIESNISEQNDEHHPELEKNVQIKDSTQPRYQNQKQKGKQRESPITEQANIDAPNVDENVSTDAIALDAALRLQMMQKIQAAKDIKTLQELKKKALADPVAFIQHFMPKEVLNPPVASSPSTSIPAAPAATKSKAKVSAAARRTTKTANARPVVPKVPLSPESKKAAKNARRREIAKERRDKERLEHEKLIAATANTQKIGEFTEQPMGDPNIYPKVIFIQGETSTTIPIPCNPAMTNGGVPIVPFEAMMPPIVVVDHWPDMPKPPLTPYTPVGMITRSRALLSNTVKSVDNAASSSKGAGINLQKTNTLPATEKGIESHPFDMRPPTIFSRMSVNSILNPTTVAPKTPPPFTTADYLKATQFRSEPLNQEEAPRTKNPFENDTIPQLQNIFRTPKIHWVKYHINGEALENMHSQATAQMMGMTLSAGHIDEHGYYQPRIGPKRPPPK